jgi:hypothetical protein
MMFVLCNIKFLLNFVMLSQVIMIVSHNFASHLEFDYTGRCVCSFSTYSHLIQHVSASLLL